LRLADIVVTEAGFGADLGAEKFFDIKCRAGDLKPEVAVIVATVRALKLHGGAPKNKLTEPDPDAVERGFANLGRHIDNIGKYGVPAIVAMNRFITDSDEELAVVRKGCEARGARVTLCNVWEDGGAGGIELAKEILDVLDKEKANFKPIYDEKKPIVEKIETIAKEIYGADGVDFSATALRKAKQLTEFGLGETPICIAKTQYSFSDDPTLLAAPEGFRINIRDMYPSAGAGFVVALAGDIMTMPGLGKTPAAEKMRVSADGVIEGLF